MATIELTTAQRDAAIREVQAAANWITAAQAARVVERLRLDASPFGQIIRAGDPAGMKGGYKGGYT